MPDKVKTKVGLIVSRDNNEIYLYFENVDEDYTRFCFVINHMFYINVCEIVSGLGMKVLWLDMKYNVSAAKFGIMIGVNGGGATEWSLLRRVLRDEIRDIIKSVHKENFVFKERKKYDVH